MFTRNPDNRSPTAHATSCLCQNIGIYLSALRYRTVCQFGEMVLLPIFTFCICSIVLEEKTSFIM